MLKNILNFEDLKRGFIRIKNNGYSYFLLKLLGNKTKRVSKTWSVNINNASSWDDISYLRNLRNEVITSNSFSSYRDYFIDKYLKDKRGLIALSPGCGVGGNEIQWAQKKVFRSINAFDISETRIQKAIKIGKELKLDNILNFNVFDIKNIKDLNTKFDIIFFEGSLHHVDSVREVLDKITEILKPDGLLLVNDFCGPSRFQWTKRQIEISQKLLVKIPERLRIMKNGYLKKRIYKPGRLKMYLADPSEASDSSNIINSLKDKFNILEYKKLGGTILNPLFSDIAHNFVDDSNNEIRNILENAIYIERENIKSGQIESDFNFIVCKL